MTRPKLKIRKGDRVVVIAGKDRGREGEVIRVLPDRRRVIVDGVNIARKHQKALRATMQAGIIDKDMPIHISNVALLCPDCGRTRVGYKLTADGRKLRVCRKCDKELD